MVTLKELARLLNISVSTVSKALNDSEEISTATKDKVKQLAEELNYRPNRIAQQLKANKTKTIGVIVPDILNPFFAEVLYGIEQEASMYGYDIIVYLSNELLDKEKRSLKLLANGSVDGFILAIARESQVKNEIEHLKRSITQGVPVVMFDRVADALECHKVVVDDYQSVYDATEYLVKKEHKKRILLLSNIEDLSVGKLRIKGYSDAMTDNGLEANINVLKLGNENDMESHIHRCLKSYPDTDAVLSIDHLTGIIAINTIKNLGKHIPEDLSVIGFGYRDAELLSSPKISIIHQKAHEMGLISTRMLIDELENIGNTKTFKTIVLQSELKLLNTTR